MFHVKKNPPVETGRLRFNTILMKTIAHHWHLFLVRMPYGHGTI